MATQRNTFDALARHLIGAAHPLIEIGTSLGAYKQTMARLGFTITAATIPPSFVSLSTAVRNATASLDALAGSVPLPKALALLAEAKKVFDGIRGLGSGPVPTGADPSAYGAEIGDLLITLLLADYLSENSPDVLAILEILNVFHASTASMTASRAAFVRKEIRWGEIPKIIGDPSGLPGRAFSWGKPTFRFSPLLDAVARYFVGQNFNVSVQPPDSKILQGYLGLSEELPQNTGWSIQLPFIGAYFGPVPVQASVLLHALPAQGAKLPGLALELRIPPTVPLELQLHPKVKMRLRAGTNSPSPFGIVLRPNEVQVKSPLAPAATPPAGGLGIGFDFNPGTSTVVFGDPEASRLEFTSASVDLNADFNNGQWSPALTFDLKGFKFIFDPGEGDGFLRFLIGGDKTEIGLPLAIRWGQDGIRFGGSGSFAVQVHPHIEIGPASIDEIDFELTMPDDPKPRLRLAIGAGISGGIGPVSFVLNGVGLLADAIFESGNAGPFDLKFGFKAPKGVGLSIDGGGFRGGGGLDFDPNKGEYSGVLELTFAEVISVRAVGILSTRLPDGKDTFSLLLIIVSEFAPIQLSYGFTLLGVGGLLGLNRTVNLDALQVGVRDGTLNSILFPTDVVANAPRIISDLKRVFPARDNRFLMGPMGKLGWGTPTLMSVEIGLLLEIPRPAFAIVGVLRLQLPAEEFGTIYIQVNFSGSVNFEKGQLQFDASLYNSRILIDPITGDMALRIYWGGDPNFLLTVGGFHPAYTPPP
jgi:hypothetical protein